MTPAVEIISEHQNSKPWLMMVHGVSQDSRVFSAQINEFKDQFNLLLVDLPGHGKSSYMDGPYGLNEFASSLKCAQDKANISASHFWGTHLGAGAGLLLAANHPERVLSLVVEAPVLPGSSLPSVIEVLKKVRAASLERGIDAAREIWFKKSAWFAVMRDNPIECRAEEQQEIIASFTGKPWLDQQLAAPVASIENELAALTTPTFIMNGEHDLADFLTVSNKVHQLMQNSWQVTIPDAGGFPLWEYPEKVNQEVRKFYTNHVL